MGKRSLISCMTQNIPCRMTFLYGMEFDVCTPLQVQFRWEVALVGKIFYWPLLTPSWDPLSSIGSVEGDDASMRP